jgi:hypothetical protein
MSVCFDALHNCCNGGCKVTDKVCESSETHLGSGRLSRVLSVSRSTETNGEVPSQNESFTREVSGHVIHDATILLSTHTLSGGQSPLLTLISIIELFQILDIFFRSKENRTSTVNVWWDYIEDSLISSRSYSSSLLISSIPLSFW